MFLFYDEKPTSMQNIKHKTISHQVTRTNPVLQQEKNYLTRARFHQQKRQVRQDFLET